MSTPKRRACRELLQRLLERHERSVSYAQPGPWPRDVILRIDATEFPREFSPDGREALEALRAAVDDLEARAAVRVVRHRGYAVREPHELRIGPAEIERAYAIAVEEGFEPLAVALAEVLGTARS